MKGHPKAFNIQEGHVGYAQVAVGEAAVRPEVD